MKMVTMLETKEPGVPQPDPNLSFPQYSDRPLLPSNPPPRQETMAHEKPSTTEPNTTRCHYPPPPRSVVLRARTSKRYRLAGEHLPRFTIPSPGTTLLTGTTRGSLLHLASV